LSRSRFAAIVSETRRGASTIFRLSPAFPAVISLGLGIVTVLGVRMWDLPAVSLGTGAGFAFFLGFRTFTAGPGWGRVPDALWFAFGAGLTWIHLALPRDSYVHVLPRVPCRTEIRGIVVSPLYQGDGLPLSRRRPSSEILLHDIRVRGDPGWHRVRGRILARLPTGGRGLPYGVEVELTGLLAQPGTAAFPGAFDYRRYLLCDGVRHILTVDRASLVSRARGYRRIGSALFRIRDRLVDRVVRGTRSPEDAQLLAAITFGCRQGLARSTRLRFVRSGAIHVFAISGLHVGIFAGLLLLVFRTLRVPFRVRYWLLPLPLGLYVFLTGGHPSGVRAWIMVTLWACGRAAFLPAAPLNTVGLAALLLLVANPLNLARAGFQFSFMIVVVLILGWPLVSKGAALADERNLWIPLRLRSRWVRTGIRRRAIQLLGAAVLAWLGSGGLVAWYNSVVIPGSILVNLFVGPLAWGTLVVSGGKLLVGCLPFWHGPELVAGRFLEMGLATMRWMTAFGARSPCSLSVTRPGLISVLFYYVFLLLVLRARQKPWHRCVMGVGFALVVLCAWPHLTEPHFRVAAVAGPGASIPAVAVRWEGKAGPVIVNAGNSTTGRILAEWLLQHGIRAADMLILADTGRAAAGGTAVLLDSLGVRTVLCFGAGRAGVELNQAFQKFFNRGGRLRFLPREGAESDEAVSVNCSGTDIEKVELDRRCELRISSAAPVRELSEVKVRIGEHRTGTVAVRREQESAWEVIFRAQSSLNGRVVVLP